MKLLLAVLLYLIVCTPTVFANDLSTKDLEDLATQELEYQAAPNQKSQTVKIKNNLSIIKKSKPGSYWSIGYQQISLNSNEFKIDSVILTTPSISKTDMLYLSASTPVIKLLNSHYLNLFGRLSYGQSQTEFQSVSKLQDGQIDSFQPTVGFSFNFYKYKNLTFKMESGFALHLYNIKTNDSKFQQSYSSQGLQNSINIFWKSFINSGFELSFSKESILSGEFEPTYSLRTGFRSEF